MISIRKLRTSDYLQPTEGEPIRSVMAESGDATVVAWHVKPGQRISAHVHPEGQDTWIILSGSGEYLLAADGASTTLSPGDVVVAHRGEVHGVQNSGREPLIFVSVVSPLHAGFEPL